ncbi:hypothetical protein FOA52_001825 [Chlamydomonas sp. UWO 241]|nr:hypothetical protein FOA52_001825 [Chlamydomonas sp. UWO 241]
MHYPGAPARDVPKILHYGLLFEFGGYKFDKHWHYDFDVAKCAPWDLNDPSKRTGGVFQHPLSVSQLKKYRGFMTNAQGAPLNDGLSPFFGDLISDFSYSEGFTKNAQGASPNDDLPQYFGDLLMMETIVTLNAGICHYHLRHCPPHQQMYDECQKALELYDDCKAEVRTVEQRMLECTDRMPARCPAWVAADQCTTNRDFMEDACRKACGLCKEGESTAERHPQPARDELENMLIQLSVELAGGVPAAGSGQGT